MMDASATDSGSRVTRSLRKRITSVDSDNSSRPGTPVPSKLISISEITASPSRSTRMTRRNSTSGVATPVKTPAKRIIASSAIIPENAETLTPARRSSRRRSVSVLENEEPSQTGPKIPSFAALDEEQTDSNLQKSRITRSQSKSPQQIKSSNALSGSPKETKDYNENKNKELEDQSLKTINQKRRKPGPKSKTGDSEELSDVEISVLENHMEEIKNKSPNVAVIVLTDDESNTQKDDKEQDIEKSAVEKVDLQDSKAVADGEIELTNVKLQIETNSNDSNLHGTDAATVDENESKFKLQIETNSNDSISNFSDTKENTNFINNNTTNIEALKEEFSVSGQTECEEPITSSTNEKNCKADEQMDHTHVNENVEKTMDNNLQENELNSSIGKTVEFKDNMKSTNVNESSTSQTMESTTSVDKIEIISVSTLTPYRGEDSNLSDCKVTSKKVDFASSPSNDMTIKNIYPKTPASTKTTNSFIEVNSSHDGSFQAEKSTPICAFKCMRPLETVQSSTPITTQASSTEELLAKEEQNHSPKGKDTSLKEEITQDAETRTTDADPSTNQTNELKWINPSVTRSTVEGCKLDAVISHNGTTASECRDNVDSFVKQAKPNKKKSIIFLSENEEEENEQDDKNEDDDNECELAPGEKPYSRKHDFHDDEAMEVDDYESGDSMDSEERREIEDNEIPIDGESIGSHTTDDEQDEYVDEEEDSENADSFIVSDNEELECSESNNEDEQIDEDTHDNSRKKKKSYKRLQRPAESSSSDEDLEIIEKESGENLKKKCIIDEENPEEGNLNHEQLENSGENIILDSSKLGDSASRMHCSAESESDDEEIDKEKMSIKNEHNRKKKTSYKRLQRPADSSSSQEDVDIVQEESEENLKEKSNSKLGIENRAEENLKHEKTQKSESNSCEFPIATDNINKSSENLILDSSKLSDSALRLHCTAESESDDEDEIDEEKMCISRKEILRKLNQSDRFNKSVRDLNPESDTSPLELDAKTLPGITQDSSNEEKSESSDEGHTTTSTPENKQHNSSKFKSESHLGEVSVTSESDADKENEHKSLILPHRRKTDSGLSVSFGNFKKPKNSKGRQEWQRSFTIDVTVKGGDLETAVTDVKLKEETVSASSPSTDDKNDEELKDKDLSNLEIMKHMPLQLGNPLIRTRRQSLALPTNPDMEICSSSHGGAANKKPKRKSLGMMSSSEFNPSQSFIDSIELQKSEHNRQVAKRKRLSKSFCGAAETLDNSIVDIDVRHLHKRSKLIGENSMAESHHDSIENINTSKQSTKICSTPHQKVGKNDSNNNIQRILSRCDEILEAANQAKLEDKIMNKKSKRKIPKKLRKKTDINLPKEATNPEGSLRGVSSEIKRKDKTKTALSQAIKAADVILGKKKQSQHNVKEHDEIESKKLPPDVLEAIEKSTLMKKKSKKGTNAKVHTTLTSAGNFMEMPQTPEKKKKKPTYIQLPTGKVSVEPVTPKKRSVLAFNGTEFRESPITPYAVGFKVRQILQPESIEPTSSILKNGKRKREHDKMPRDQVSPKSQWTQSGLFIEENILKSRIPRSGNQQVDNSRNFKENAIMRPDIKRSTKREMLLLKDRRQKHGYY